MQGSTEYSSQGQPAERHSGKHAGTYGWFNIVGAQSVAGSGERCGKMDSLKIRAEKLELDCIHSPATFFQ